MSEANTIIIGGGHNALTAAFYLAKSGRKPLVLERRRIVGGAATSEDFAPGYRWIPYRGETREFRGTPGAPRRSD